MKKETITIDFSWIPDFFIRIKLIFNPRYWSMNESYSPQWDKKLRDLMKEHTFRDLGNTGCSAVLGNEEIWVANHPYASFTNGFNKSEGRPSRLTIYKAYEKLIKDREKNRVEGIVPMGYVEWYDIREGRYNTPSTIGNGRSSTGSISYEDWGSIHAIAGGSIGDGLMATGVKDIGNGIPSNWENEI